MESSENLSGEKKAEVPSPPLSEPPKPPFPPQGISPPGIEAKMPTRPLFEAPAYKAAGKLEGKVALITGGDSGIGRAVALLYVKEGAKVAFTYLPEEEEDALATLDLLRKAGGEAVAFAGDLMEARFCQKAVEATLDAFGRLDILVNNAAFQNHVPTLEELSPEQWERTFRVNVFAPYFLARAALPHMELGSCIINTGSVTGIEGSPKLLDYASTKGALHAFTKSLAVNLVQRGIRVNCVAPGPVWTPLNPAERADEEVATFGQKVPYGRPAQPEEIAPAYVYLASLADSSYVTGEVLAILGGETRAG